MKLGMPILYQFNSIEENLILAKELNLDFIELNLNFSYCRNEIENNNLEILLKKYNMEATLHFFDETDLGSYDEIVDAYFLLFKKYITLSKNYIKNVNIHNNVGPLVTISGIKNYIYEKEYNSYINKLIKNIKIWDEFSKENNVNLLLENTKIPPFMKNVYIEELRNNFNFTYDIGHDDTSSYELKKLIEQYNFVFKEFHFHDGNTKTCHLALNEGTMNLKYFKNLAIRNGAYVVLEVKNKDDLIKSVNRFNNL